MYFDELKNYTKNDFHNLFSYENNKLIYLFSNKKGYKKYITLLSYQNFIFNFNMEAKHLNDINNDIYLTYNNLKSEIQKKFKKEEIKHPYFVIYELDKVKKLIESGKHSFDNKADVIDNLKIALNGEDVNSVYEAYNKTDQFTRSFFSSGFNAYLSYLLISNQ